MTDSTTTSTTHDGETDKYLEALRRFGAAGDTRMAAQVLDSMRQRGVAITPAHWELVLKAHLDRREVTQALAVLDQLKAAGGEVGPAIRFELAVAASRAGRLDVATQVVEQLDGEGYRTPAQDAPRSFSLFLALRRFPAARAVLRQMADAGQAARPEEYDVLLDDCLARRAIKDTRAVVDLMMKVAVLPSAERATALVAMMARAGHAERAHELRSDLAAAGVNVGPDAWEALLTAARKSSDPAAMPAVIEAMAAAGVQPNSYHRNLLLQLAATGDGASLEGAWSRAAELLDAGQIPSSASLEALVDVSLKASRTDLAQAAIDWMVILGVPVPAPKVADLVAALLAAKEIDRALETYNEALRLGVPGDRKNGSGLYHELLRAGRLDEAISFLDDLRKHRVLTHGRHYGALVVALLKADRADEALAMFSDLLDRKVAPSSQDASKVVGALVKATNLDQAAMLLDRLAEVGTVVDEPTFRELMWAFARKRNAEQTQHVLDRMTAAGLTPDHRHESAIKWARGETVERLDDGDEPTVPTPPADGAPTPVAEPAPSAPVAEPEPEPQPAAPAASPEPAPSEPEPAPSEPEPAAPAADPVLAEPTPVLVEPSTPESAPAEDAAELEAVTAETVVEPVEAEPESTPNVAPEPVVSTEQLEPSDPAPGASPAPPPIGHQPDQA